MKDLYYLDAQGDTVGPIVLTEVPLHPITPKTLMWRPGMTQWVEAKDMDGVLEYLPPVVEKPSPSVVVPPIPDVYGMDKPSNYMWLSVLVILASLCTCISLPFGIVALVYSFQVDDNWQKGYYDAAVECSDKARNWACIGIYIPLILIVFYILFAL